MKSTIWMSALALAVLGIAAGCGEKAAEPETTPPANTTESTMNTPAPEGTMTPDGGMQTAAVVDYTNDKGEIICPVKGDVIPDKTKAAGFQDYEGKRYYFCCAGCPEEFAADPAKFAHKTDAAAKDAGSDMHGM